MAVNYLTGHNVTFEEANCEAAAPRAATIENTKARRIFIDEEHQGDKEHRKQEFLSILQAGNINWVSLFLNQLRHLY